MKRLVSISDIDKYISNFIPKLFFVIEEDENFNVLVWVPKQFMKFVFTKLCYKMSRAISLKVLPIERRSQNE